MDRPHDYIQLGEQILREDRTPVRQCQLGAGENPSQGAHPFESAQRARSRPSVAGGQDGGRLVAIQAAPGFRGEDEVGTVVGDGDLRDHSPWERDSRWVVMSSQQ